jgi:hypothetical protein
LNNVALPRQARDTTHTQQNQEQKGWLCVTISNALHRWAHRDEIEKRIHASNDCVPVVRARVSESSRLKYLSQDCDWSYLVLARLASRKASEGDAPNTPSRAEHSKVERVVTAFVCNVRRDQEETDRIDSLSRACPFKNKPINCQSPSSVSVSEQN